MLLETPVVLSFLAGGGQGGRVFLQVVKDVMIHTNSSACILHFNDPICMISIGSPLANQSHSSFFVKRSACILSFLFLLLIFGHAFFIKWLWFDTVL